ncbi:pur operon repressor [Alicyclobacillus sp. TC]|uniref:Purine operon repressor, PurR n=1 Tax=Alicyclobacillus tolerans TaxID=90970 RepID=A0A1M6PHN0_9BACL|nr:MULTISPECIES: pur operon repressor [Alicyclobacillus]QRF22346.1 pur operon repressor [Alicyclobacillus sp. TC]SHK07407.1 purine operon repressor, PurR [Alicyclobacillus montanus]
MRRSSRLLAMAKRLFDRPHHVYSLSELAGSEVAAKSTLSEDVAFLRAFLEETQEGTIESLPGASGGVRFTVGMPDSIRLRFLERLASELSHPSRMLPGGFIYMSDILGQPDVLDNIGRMIAAEMAKVQPNVVVTVETKGIPLAVATARYLDVPLVIVRREHKVTEGAALSMHYVSGSERRISTMYVSKRALPERARALVVDDFMKAGATAQAVRALLAEFSVEVVGTAVFVKTEEPQKKLISDYLALLEVKATQLDGSIFVQPVYHA